MAITEHDLTGFDSAELIDTVRPCDLCGATGSLDTPGDPSSKIRICTGCGFVHVKERRSIEEVAQAWDQIYANGGYDPDWPGVKARLFYVSEWIGQHIGLDGRSVLDIGAGNGLFLEFCRDRGAHVVGLDPSSKNVAIVKSKDIACFHGWAADSSPDIGQYDIVTLNWTLENTGDCLEVLRYAKRQLAPNGHLVVATGSRIYGGFRKPLSCYIPQDRSYPHDTHCFRWSIRSLRRAFVRVGLSKGRTNDWDQRDEMIVTAIDAGGATCLDEGKERPEDVLDHFRRWHEQFP